MLILTAPIENRLASTDLEPIRQLYAEGLCLQAYHRAEALAPLRSWTGPEARVLAGRLAIHLGAPRLCFLMHLRAWREDREHPEACYYYARGLLERRGPLAAWRFLHRRGAELPGADERLQSDWLAFHGCILGRLRDFDAAEAWLDRAETTCPGQPWTQIERAALFEWEDRYEESLAAGRRALELRPWYRPGVQCVAHTLQLLGRDHEALDLLTEGAARIESTLVLAQLAALQTELGHHADARQTYARFHELAVLMEKDGASWLAARRSDAAYFCGDLTEAATLAREAGGPLYTSIADNLANPEFQPQRVLLDVGFVRQHHQTCAPATLAAISRYWQRAAEHLEVAEAICYDGTPDHRERAWAEDHGYVCREFSMTWDAAKALLDRGVPFTLTTIEPGNAHLQAVIGYDTCRKSLLVRDPYVRNHVEYHADSMLEHYRATGPRGHALVPREEAHRLDGLDLPDAALYDRVYAMQRALQRYDRDTAAAILTELKAEAPDHRLTWQARRIIALYDSDTTELLTSVEGLLTLYPDEPLFLLGKLACLRDLARRDERLAILQSACARKDANPLFCRLYAQELLPDAREHPTAIRMLSRAIRFRPYDEGNFSTLGSLFWSQRRFEEAMELYGFAACLGDKNEGLARDYFLAARHLKRTEETLAFLRRRFERFGQRSSQPARTLTWAYEAFERTAEGLKLLDEALALRPDDGELMLFAAESHAQAGDFARAEGLLAAAEGRTPRTAWLRTAAGLARTAGDLPRALGLWRQVAEAEPMAPDAASALAQLLAETEGLPAALRYLEEVCNRFPYNYALHQIWCQWGAREGAAAQEPIVRRALAIHPADAWARRELALVLSDQRRLDEAFAELEVAGHLEPHSPSYHCVRGQVCERAGRREEAREAYREAVRLSVDTDFAIMRLMESSQSLAERREVLRFVWGELVRQVIFGDGLLAYGQYARRTLEPEELLAALRKAHEARPDLWHAWSALVVQLTEMGRAEEARELARQATEHFPLLSPLWLDLAAACAACGDPAGEAEALRKAAQVRPGWVAPLRRLGEVHLRDGKAKEAIPFLEQAVARAPLDAPSHGWLAEALWQAGEKERALERVQLALTIEPGYEWAWGALRSWSAQLGKPDLAIAVSRALTERRPDEARSWMKLAEMLDGDDTLDERLAAVERALTLNPRLADAYDLRATLLARAGRYKEAEEACLAPVWNGSVPLILRGRLAWLAAQQGQVKDAIGVMRSALEEDPDYFWGWSNLVDWVREQGTNKEYLEAAENLVRLTPERAISYGYRGEARRRCEDRAGAKADLKRALDMDPAYGFAGLALFDEQLADGELDDAARTLEITKTHDRDDAYIAAREVRLAARRGDREAAKAALRRLVEMPEEATWPVEAASAACDDAGWSADVEEALAVALTAATPSLPAIRRWVERLTQRGAWDACEARLASLADDSPATGDALCAYLHQLGTSRQANRLRTYLRRERDRLRRATLPWGAAGYALTCINAFKEAADWMADWQKRDDLKPWMLINLVIALRALGDDEQSARAGRRALELPRDHTSHHHAVWLALDEALVGRAVQAQASLAGEHPGHDSTHRFLKALIDALALVEAEQGRGLSEARRLLRDAAKACCPLVEDRPAVAHMYRRTVARLAEVSGGWSARLWALWRRLVPLIPARQ